MSAETQICCEARVQSEAQEGSELLVHLLLTSCCCCIIVLCLYSGLFSESSPEWVLFVLTCVPDSMDTPSSDVFSWDLNQPLHLLPYKLRERLRRNFRVRKKTVYDFKCTPFKNIWSHCLEISLNHSESSSPRLVLFFLLWMEGWWRAFCRRTRSINE